MSSEHRTAESASRHYGLKRSVRVAASGEAGFVKGAGVVFSESPGLKLQRRAFIVWDDDGPQSVFIVKKPHSLEASAKMKEIGDWLTSKGLKVLVERSVHTREFPEFDCFDPLQNDVDFCVTLGGDGTVLHLASLFREDEPLPPLASFAMGTLGFLTPFDAADFEACLQRVLSATELPVFCTLRTRKRCELYRDGQLHAVHHVLNECLIDRGSSPSMVRLELYVDGHHITTVRADGLIIATPSGSTAYSLSAGGPMVAPSVPCALLTPIAPHSLSFRPLVVPEASDIEIHLPAASRSHARASFDGRNTQRMMAGSSIRCTTSLCALPVINLAPLDNDWYDGIVQKLKWNVSISPREVARLPSLKKPSYEDNNSASPLSSF
ncbi:NAD(H) kinase 1 [Coccomyxa sp. Obi]|nr:NAD(H) kinase 1 [Coccomyxa sp. Obi]